MLQQDGLPADIFNLVSQLSPSHFCLSLFVAIAFIISRHSPAMIEKLKRAGLGYNVSDKDTKDKFGKC